jgi:hypothetical protein
MTLRAQRGLALALGGLCALLFSAIAAVQVAGWTIGAVEQSNHQVIPGPIDRLSVDAGAAEIVVLPELGGGGKTTIDSTAKGSFHAPVLRAVKNGGEVRMDGNCPYISFGPCQARVVIRVPAATELDIHSGSGDLTATGMTGRVKLETGSGDVNADGLRGDADLRTGSGNVNVRAVEGATRMRTGSGDINAEDLGAADVLADTSSGDVTLDFRGAPSVVDASTASGDVDVVVPRPDAYRVDADPGSGDQQVAVKTDPDSTRVVRARTSSGDVTVGYGN